jgi:hypothetical protein
MPRTRRFWRSCSRSCRFISADFRENVKSLIYLFDKAGDLRFPYLQTLKDPSDEQRTKRNTIQTNFEHSPEKGDCACYSQGQ